MFVELRHQHTVFRPLLIHIPKTGGSSLEHAIVSSYLKDVNESQLEDLAYEHFSEESFWSFSNIPFA